MARARPAAERPAPEARRPRAAPLRAVSTRTEPPLPPARLVERPRLRDQLLGAVPLGLAVVVAPGGFGKTVVLADLAAHAPFPLTWLTVGPAEADLVAFVEATTGVMRQIVPKFGRQAVKIARQTGEGVIPALADELAGELADHGAPIGLVLDDFHAADSAGDVARLVAALVERLPSNFFLAVASRTLPALPYARLLALGKMAGLPADELRFTPEETARFLDRAPGDAEAARVHDATGGWAAALALGTGSSGFVGAVDEYLEHEVFDQQPPEVRDFLLKAAVPPTLDEDVCRRILGAPNGPAVLARAHRGGLFVAALPDGGWRIHDLFRDFLRARLRQGDPLGWEQLNRAVADDLAASRRPVEAVTQLVDADLPEAAADLLLVHAETFAAEGRWGAIRGWLDRLPPRVVEARPRLLTLHGRALMPSSPAAAVGLFDRAVDACLGAGDDLGAAEALAYRAARLMISSRYDEAAEDCARVHELLGGHDHPAAATAARVEGLIAGRNGQFDVAKARLREALARAERSRDRSLVAMCERALGWAYSTSGDVGRAASYYERSAHAWETIGDLSALAEVKVSLGHTYAAQGAVEQARSCFADALRMGERTDQPRVQGFALDNLAILDREDGRPEVSLRTLTEAVELARRSDDGHLLAMCLDQMARSERLLPAALKDAEARARQAIAEAERVKLPSLVARATVTLAATVLAQGRTSEALAIARDVSPALSSSGESPDRVRLSLATAAAAHALNDPSWRGEIALAAQLIAQLPNRRFLHEEVSALAVPLAQMAADPEVGAAAEAILSAGSVPTERARPEPKVDRSGQYPMVEVRLLGRVELRVDGEAPSDPARFWSRRPTRLLFFLLEQSRQGLTADALIDRLWPEAEPGQGQSLLWDTVCRLRSVLNVGNRQRGRELVQLQDGIYRLNPELPLRTDVAAFEANATRGLGVAPGSDEELEALTLADALYRGPYLEGLDEPWLLVRRGELARLHVRVLRRLVERTVEDGAPERAIQLSARLVRLLPRSQTACQLHVRALRKAGEAERAAQVERAFARRTAVPDDELAAATVRTRRT